MPLSAHRRRGMLSRRQGFTLLEMLVSLVIVAIILFATMSLMNVVTNTYKRGTGQLDSFEVARTAFNTLTRTLQQATLLSYLGYDDPQAPTEYRLKSSLHFVSGPQKDLPLDGTGGENSHAVFFQAPLGVVDNASLQGANAVLTAVGFFIAYGDDPIRPPILSGKTPTRYRYRLFQFLQPREEMTVYNFTLKPVNGVLVANESYKGLDWFKGDVEVGKFCRPIAENVIALAILPIFEDHPADTYLWNSRDPAVEYSHNRLPQSLKVVLAVLNEESAERLGNSLTPPVLLPENIFTDPAKFETDIGELEKTLSGFSPRLTFRVFTADILLNAANTSL